MADTPIPVVRLLPGVVVDRAGAAGTFDVNVNGSRPPVWWPAGYIPTAGDAVRVLLVDGQAQVLGPVIDGQRPGEGTVSGGASAGLVPVDTTSGTVHARYTGTAPGIGDAVFLDWQMTTPRVLAGVATAVPDPTPGGGPDQPAPPPPSAAGVHHVAALDSGTWSSRGVWDSYYGSHLTQGSYSGRSYTGAWFYGAAPQQIAGRTVTRFQIRLGARRHMGSYNSALSLNLYLHSSGSRPGGDVTRIAGPHTVVLPPGAGPMWVDLPTSWGQGLSTGLGGIGIGGGSYGGVTGVGGDPASGQLAFDWRV